MSRSWLNILIIFILFGYLKIGRTDDTLNVTAPMVNRPANETVEEHNERVKRDTPGTSSYSDHTREILMGAAVAIHFFPSVYTPPLDISNTIYRIDDPVILKTIDDEKSVKSIEGLKDLSDLEKMVKDADVTNKPFSKGDIMIYVSPQVETKLPKGAGTKVIKGWTGCRIQIKWLDYYYPLIIDPEHHDKLKYPQDDDGHIFFRSGEKVFLSCVYSTFKFFPTYHSMTWTCSHGSLFQIGSIVMSFYDLKCDSYQLSTISFTYLYYNSNKNGDTSLVKIQEVKEYFRVDEEDTKLTFRTFVSEEKDYRNLYYARSVISRSIKGGQFIDNNPRLKVPQPSITEHWRIEKFYQENPQDLAFQRQLQSTINDISSIRDRIGPAQLIHKTSFVYEILAWYSSFFLNISPQWQTIYYNNWAVISRHVNKMATYMYRDLTVLTGTHEDLRIKNRDGTDSKRLYLHYYQSDELKYMGEIPIKLYFFKIVIEPESKAGVVFVTVNNPYLKNPDQHHLCESPEFPELSSTKTNNWDAKNVTFGYSYTCSVNDFFKGSGFPIRDKATIGIDQLLPVKLQYRRDEL